jgi:hypothetical protein
MKMHTVWGAVALAGAAFTAGLYWSSANTAVAEPSQDVPTDVPPEIMEQMEAWEKVSQPGINHQYLDKLAGTWEGTFRMRMAPDGEPMESTGSVRRDWVLNGRFLKEESHGVSALGEFNGLGFIGFNNIEGRYEFVWMEDHSTAIMSGTGSFDPDEKTFRWHSEYKEPGGRVVDTWSKLEMLSSSHHVYTGWAISPEGKTYKNFEGKVTRK